MYTIENSAGHSRPAVRIWRDPIILPVGPPSGTYTVDTFEFVHSKPPQNAAEPNPNILDRHEYEIEQVIRRNNDEQPAMCGEDRLHG